MQNCGSHIQFLQGVLGGCALFLSCSLGKALAVLLWLWLRAGRVTSWLVGMQASQGGESKHLLLWCVLVVQCSGSIWIVSPCTHRLLEKGVPTELQ